MGKREMETDNESSERSGIYKMAVEELQKKKKKGRSISSSSFVSF